jgi:GT2 family glycosyltransferase
MPSPEPIRLLEIEISDPIPAIAAVDEQSGARYERARSFVRLHTQPLGLVELELGGKGLRAADYADRIWAALQAEVVSHLDADGLPVPERLTEHGLPTPDLPACLEERRRMFANAPFASIVVPTRDGSDRLPPCLGSLQACAYPHDRYEIIVVDNAPQTDQVQQLVVGGFGAYQVDGAADLMDGDTRTPRLIYVREDQPGLSRARNRGLELASGEFVAFIDDDETADAEWLGSHVAALRLHEGVACSTGLTLPAELETAAQCWFEQFGGHSEGRGFIPTVITTSSLTRQHPLYPFPPFGVGGNMAFSTSVLRDIGGFDPALGAGTPTRGGEDTAAFAEVLLAGHGLVYEPGALVRHVHRREAEALREQLRSYGTGLTAYFTWCLHRHPLKTVELLTMSGDAIRYLAARNGGHGKQIEPDFPKSLLRSQRLAMLRGPLAYARSSWHVGITRRKAG